MPEVDISGRAGYSKAMLGQPGYGAKGFFDDPAKPHENEPRPDDARNNAKLLVVLIAIGVVLAAVLVL